MEHPNYHFSNRACSVTLMTSKGLSYWLREGMVVLSWLYNTHTQKNVLAFWRNLGVNDSSQKINTYFFHSNRLASDGLLTSHYDNNTSSWPFCCFSKKSHKEIVEHVQRRTVLLLGPWSNILILRNYSQLYTSPRRKSLASEITNWSTKLLYDWD